MECQIYAFARVGIVRYVRVEYLVLAYEYVAHHVVWPDVRPMGAMLAVRITWRYRFTNGYNLSILCMVSVPGDTLRWLSVYGVS